MVLEDMAQVYREKPGMLQARVKRVLSKLRAWLEARTEGRP